MIKIISHFLMNLLLIPMGFPQQLQDTAWKSYWAEPVNDSVKICFIGNDSFTLKSLPGSLLASGKYTENSDTLTFHAVSGPMSCLPSFPDVYKFHVSDKSLYFSLWNDDCAGRSLMLPSNAFEQSRLANSVSDGSKAGLDIDPRPVKDQVYIELSEVYDQIELQLLDVSGKLIYTNYYTNVSLIDLDFSRYVSGIYFALLMSGTGSTMIRIDMAN